MISLLKYHIEGLYPGTYTELYIKNNILFCRFNDRFCGSHFLDVTLKKTAGHGTRVREHIIVNREFLSADIQIKMKKCK